VTTERRLDALDANLTPTEFVLRWLDEVHAYDDLPAYGRWLADQGTEVHPASRLAREAAESTKARMRGRHQEELVDAVDRALRAALVRFELFLRLNTVAQETVEDETMIRTILSLRYALFFEERRHAPRDVPPSRLEDPRFWHTLATAQLTRIHAQQLARERLQIRYFEGREVLFPAVRRRWDELVLECRKLVLLTYRWLELEELTEGDMDEAIPDDEVVGHWVDDLLQPARAMALEKLDETDRSYALASQWVRSKHDRASAQHEPVSEASEA
jgi:hypothetical protein